MSSEKLITGDGSARKTQGLLENVDNLAQQEGEKKRDGGARGQEKEKI